MIILFNYQPFSKQTLNKDIFLHICQMVCKFVVPVSCANIKHDKNKMVVK